MHTFLQGERNIGKSTVISKTLDIISTRGPVSLGGFFTWKNDEAVPQVFMRPAWKPEGSEAFLIASYDEGTGRMAGDIRVFETEGVRILCECDGARLIIMDELGKFESGAPLFRRAVFDILAGEAPVLGVLRLDETPWLDPIRSDPSVCLIDVNLGNREDMPFELADRLMALI